MCVWNWAKYSHCLLSAADNGANSTACRRRDQRERERERAAHPFVSISALYFPDPPAISMDVRAKLLIYILFVCTRQRLRLFWLPLLTRSNGWFDQTKNTCNCATGYANKLMTWDWTFGHLQWNSITQKRICRLNETLEKLWFFHFWISEQTYFNQECNNDYILLLAWR